MCRSSVELHGYEGVTRCVEKKLNPYQIKILGLSVFAKGIIERDVTCKVTM